MKSINRMLKLIMKNKARIVFGLIGIGMIVFVMYVVMKDEFRAPPASIPEESGFPVQGNIGVVLAAISKDLAKAKPVNAQQAKKGQSAKPVQQAKQGQSVKSVQQANALRPGSGVPEMQGIVPVSSRQNAAMMSKSIPGSLLILENMMGLAPYQANTRCAKEGQDASAGCCQFMPPLVKDEKTGKCVLHNVN